VAGNFVRRKVGMTSGLASVPRLVSIMTAIISDRKLLVFDTFDFIG